MIAMRTCILVPLDLSGASRTVVERAADLARATGARVELLHVVTRHEALAARDDVVKQLDSLSQPLRAAQIPVGVHVVAGEPVAEILAAIPRLGADSIVIGARGHCATYERVVGSVTEGVLRGRACPVEVVPVH
jgi:nucleotide-binding universal stress UspA family protein